VPVTTLDRTTALIVVDLQAGLAGMPTVHPFDDVVAPSPSSPGGRSTTPTWLST
jgi:hypothetical protein